MRISWTDDYYKSEHITNTRVDTTTRSLQGEHIYNNHNGKHNNAITTRMNIYITITRDTTTALINTSIWIEPIISFIMRTRKMSISYKTVDYDDDLNLVISITYSSFFLRKKTTMVRLKVKKM